MGKGNNSSTVGETKRDYAPLPEITGENANEVKTAEPLYTAAELSAAARDKFGTSPEVVETALKSANKAKATLNEAAAIVKAFLEREVR